MAASRSKPFFPFNRIKKIMQVDEEVGKLASATPSVVSKAVELFLIDLINAAYTESQNVSSSRLTPTHLRHAILNNANFDFCSELVEGVPDTDEPEVVKKRGRKRKAVASDDGGAGDDATPDVEATPPASKAKKPRAASKKSTSTAVSKRRKASVLTAPDEKEVIAEVTEAVFDDGEQREISSPVAEDLPEDVLST